MARNPEGTIIEIFVDPIAQLGFKVDRLGPIAKEDVTTGVRLYIPRPKCVACGHEPPDGEPLVEHVWIMPQHPILGPVETWAGGFKYGLQRPKEAE